MRENQQIREENVIIKNLNKVDKANNANKIKELETQVKQYKNV